MLPDRVSNPGPLNLRVRCPTDCATRPRVRVTEVILNTVISCPTFVGFICFFIFLTEKRQAATNCVGK